MRSKLLLFLGLFIGSSLVGFTQKQLTIKDAVLGRWTRLAPERLDQISWIPKTNDYVYVDKSDGAQELVKVNAESFEKTSLLKLETLSSKLELVKPLTRFPQLRWLDEKNVAFVVSGKVYTYSMDKGEIKMKYAIPEGAVNVEFKDKSTDMAYTKGNNLFAVINGEIIQVTNEKDPNIVSGQTVSRVEFGIEKGFFWSPDGKQLAFYQKDESAVTNYPIVDLKTRPAQAAPIKYPMAGMASEMVKVGIYSFSNGKTMFLQTDGGKEQYLTSVTWEPSGKHIYVGHLKRNQKHFMLKKYAVKSGKYVLKMFEETNTKYVHPVDPLYFLDNQMFAWVSERSGVRQFYLYSIEGEPLGHLSCEDIIVRKYIGYDKTKERIYFIGNHKDKIEQHVFELYISKDMASYSTDNRTVYNYHQHSEDGANYRWAQMSDDGRFLLVNSSSPVVPNEYELIETDEEVSSSIFMAEDPLKDYAMGEMELFHLPINDSTSLFARMIKPYDFDPFTKYPVLIYVYNGPGVQLLSNSWLGGAPLWMYYFANKGYIVFTVDGRGSANRGIAFEQMTFRKLGQVEMEDQMAGVEFLKKLKYVDSTRIGLHGWSYGGFMTISLMENYPDAFKVGVAGGPVTDWRYYEVMYTERYMETPAMNEEGYNLSSTLNKTQNLKGKLMLIHGTSDPTVVMQHSELFLKSCIDNGVQVDYFVYPGHEHNVRGKDRVHLMEKVLKYIEDNL